MECGVWDGLIIFLSMKYKFEDLVDILKRLRAEDGCPWDRVQDTHSLLPYLVEESSEFIDAALDGDKAHMCEELGDVLLQVVFHSQVCKESGDFNIDDVVQGICEKMIRRHPHVFGDVKVNSSDEVIKNWEEIKSGEKKESEDKYLCESFDESKMLIDMAKKRKGLET